MAIARRLPNSDQTRDRALTSAKTRKDNVAPPDMAITPATIARLNVIQPDFKDKMQLRSDAERDQTTAGRIVNKAKRFAIMFISHFIQVFNFGVKREVYPAEDRNFYQLPVDNDNLPDINTEAEITQWGGRIVTGDVNRLAAGGAPMTNPKATDVGLKVTAFDTANNDQANKKLAYDHAQEAVDALRTEADGVIKKVWDEVETFYNEETPSSMRRKAREWGVIYISDILETIHVTVEDSATQAPIAGAELTINETGETFLTGADGKKDIK
ncbi:MAG: hypothetical protein JJE25_04735, partial [Bacteroidia bacterium]|nr:hypothetical protein [Bacteroidia bacterium]